MDDVYSESASAGVETILGGIAATFANNPLLGVGAVVLILAALLVPAQRRRRR